MPTIAQRHTLRAAYGVYLLLRSAAPFAVTGGFPLAIAIVAGTSAAVAICVSLAAILAHVPFYVTHTYGSSKEIAGSRVYVGAFWIAMIAGAAALMFLHDRDRPGDGLIADQLAGLGTLGVVLLLVNNVKIAAETVAAPTDNDEAGSGLTAQRFVRLARTQRDSVLAGAASYAFVLGLMIIAVFLMVEVVDPEAEGQAAGLAVGVPLASGMILWATSVYASRWVISHYEPH